MKATSSAIRDIRVHPGQWWSISGRVQERITEVNGYRILEYQFEATSCTLLRPSGEHIINFIADNPDFSGIGPVKARKLWETFGDKLYHLLDTRDSSTLATILTSESAAQAVKAWAQHGDSQTLQWLQAKGFDLKLGRKVLEFYAEETVQKLDEDPYRLLSFCASWERVDALARVHFGLNADDPRRLQGAIEEACYRMFTAGHTAGSITTVMGFLKTILGSQTSSFRWRKLVSEALSQGLTNGSFVVSPQGIQALGPLVMERQVASAVAVRVRTAKEVAPELPSSAYINRLIAAYERVERIVLNKEQNEAVHLGVTSRFGLIIGGAGVGKTTTLRALYHVLDAVGVQVVQLALAGRAAKRMQEATGRSATTLASFLRNPKSGSLDGGSLIVIDEASMVDIITMNGLCELIGPAPRLLLVGDPAQLMPVGPGLVLHVLAQMPPIPKVQLQTVKRYGGDIGLAASAIREGHWPNLTENPDEPIAFIPCSADAYEGKDSIAEIVVGLYRDDPTNTQVLCTKRNGPAGTGWLNTLCQNTLASTDDALMVWSRQHGTYVHTGFRLSDPVLCTRNIRDRGLQNGSLGVIAKIEQISYGKVGTQLAADLVIGWIDWDDGERRPIVEDMLDDLQLGYAITVHKAQGSQWPRVVVALTGHRSLDRTLVYTAVTRAQRQVILVGNVEAVKAAVAAVPQAQLRRVELDAHVCAALS
ncbi:MULTISPECIES: AAA family ATPase [unclassified Massilia]|uniref:AAA family ATPase n=1 Tax=unclassified Massilia TaxID=2609279 RepID=UPI0012E22EF4|nr:MULTISPECIES: AAA family ATPase [unclassified Massilia]